MSITFLYFLFIYFLTLIKIYSFFSVQVNAADSFTVSCFFICSTRCTNLRSYDCLEYNAESIKFLSVELSKIISAFSILFFIISISFFKISVLDSDKLYLKIFLPNTQSLIFNNITPDLILFVLVFDVS